MLALLAPLAAAAPLLVEGFDTTTLDGWTVKDGAQVGTGAESRYAVEEGALVLRVRADDQRFKALLRTVPLGGATSIRVRARMRTEGVDPAPARFDNCDVFVRFPGGPVQALPVRTGTTPWTALERVFPVPAGATEVTVGLFLSMPGVAWFDDVQVEPADDVAWAEARSDHFTFHTLPGDALSADAVRRNEADHARISAFLGTSADTRVDYWKYPDADTKERLTGNRGNGHADGRGVHSLFTTHPHELTHVLARPLGDPPPLLGEGLAVFLSGQWQGRPAREAAARVDGWVPLATLLDGATFRATPELVAYAEAGARCAWIAEAKGRDTLLAAYRAVRADAAAIDNAAALREVLGLSMGEIDAAVRAWAAAR